MNPEDVKRLRLNRVDIVETIRAHDVQDLLYQEEVLNDEDLEYISLERGITPHDAVRRLLKILPDRTHDAFDVFIEALRKDYDWLADQIKNTDVSRVVPDEPDGGDKLKAVQQRLFMQTDLLIQCQQELQELRKKVSEGGTSQNDLTEKYVELDQLLKDTGVTETQVIDYMREYLHNKGPLLDATDSRDLLQPPPGIHDTSNKYDFEETVARCLGKDIVQFVINGKNAGPPPNIYAATLRRTVTEITQRYGDLFENYLETLNIDEKNGYDALVSVANEIFKSGAKNWGRVVVHYAFGAWIAKHISGGNHAMPAVNFIGDFLGYYVHQNAAVWIKGRGGWDNFIAHFDKEFPEKNAGDDKHQAWGGIILTTMALASLVAIVTLNRS